MSLSINSNSAASSILSNLNNVQNEMNTSYQQLSTGNQVSSAADNPASYAISQQMTSQINGLNQATQNAQNGISLIQTATGAMNQTEQVLQTMSTLATEAANAGNTFSDRANLQLEMNALAQQINSTTNQTQYNGINLLTGQFGAGNSNLNLQIGANQGQTLSFNIGATDVQTLGVNGGSQATGGTDTIGTDTVTGDTTNIKQAATPAAIASSITASNSLLQSGMSLKLVFTANVSAGSAGVSGTASSGTLQLETSDGTNIGNAIQLSATDISGGLSDVTIGDSATGATLSISTGALSDLFSVSADNASGTYTQSDTITLTGSNASTSASASNGWQASTSVNGINIMDQSDAQNAITSIQNAINTLSSSQAQLGAVQNRLNYTVSNLNNSSQNLSNAQSTITNTDMAAAYTQFSQQQVLEQVGISMLSQAQQQPQMILKLLQ
ncbi:flagellin [Alicyclobacillus fastidiosus]|uniref:Flagellin n=2 Tax=Alicyclobacillus TaxID=29330 RepID=A0ABY6ZIN7_9BACL|nr:flagellin [Alicyclobacillus fastidiosus]WAH42640.1 flagellin [Alicyclobacillus fastidiosus]GMA64514.1 flagellin [Alicyclobacillus fastidiosus]